LKKLIIYSEIRWSFLDQRHHHLARYAAGQGVEVEFVERVVSRIPSVKELLRKFVRSQAPSSASRLKSEKPLPKGIILRRSLFLPPISPVTRSINGLLWLIHERHRQRDAWVYSFVDNPTIIGNFPSFAKGVARVTAFDIIHNWWEFPWNTKQHSTLVDKCLKCYSSVITDSPAISKRLNAMAVEHHLMLPGVDAEWLGAASSEGLPKAVFFGNLRSNSDVELVSAISDRFGLDVYGIVDASIAEKVSHVNFRGALAPADLIPRLADYNLIVLPYSSSSFSRSIAPAKYFEALATGALVVTGSDLSHLPGFDDYVLRLEESDDLEGRIRSSLAQQAAIRAEQISFVKNHTWELRFQELFEFLCMRDGTSE
jgi:hypothetical protein